MHLCTHKDTATTTHTKYIKLVPKRGREREEESRANNKMQKQMDTNLYLFVHFDVEAIRHLIVLRRTESQMVRSVKTILNLSNN